MLYTVAYYLNIFLLSPIIVFGLLGNCLSMLTWSRGSHSDSSTAVLLTALAVMDTVVLCVPAVEFWTLEAFNIQIRALNIVLCKIFPFASYFAPTTSSWILVLVTAERLVSIWFPVKVRHLCTRIKVGLCLLLLIIVVSVLYSPFLLATSVIPFHFGNETIYRCDILRNGTFYQDYYKTWMWIDLCSLFMLPFLLIVVGNLLILYKLFASRKMFRKEGRNMSFRVRMANAFTLRALALSLTFCLCTCPVTINEVYRAYSGHVINKLGSVIILIFLYANSSINFILYCVIGTGFRKDMKTVLMSLCCSRKFAAKQRDALMNYTYQTGLSVHERPLGRERAHSSVF